jgi:hypothetical protein
MIRHALLGLLVQTSSTGIHSFSIRLLPQAASRQFRYCGTTADQHDGNVELNGSNNDVSEGDFAGFMAFYNVPDGTLQELPEFWIPATLREWGQVPKSLEVLRYQYPIHRDNVESASHTMSNNVTTTTTSDSSTAVSWERFTSTIVPEIGCAVDSLSTVPSHETLRVPGTIHFFPPQYPSSASQSMDMISPQPMVVTTVSGNTMKSFLEASFPFKHDAIPFNNNDTCLYRIVTQIGVSKSATNQCWEINSPLSVVWERRFESLPSRGLHIQKHRGLDGQSVATWLGSTLRKQQENWTDVIFSLPNETNNHADDENRHANVHVVPLCLGLQLQYWYEIEKLHGNANIVTSLKIDMIHHSDDNSRHVVSWTIPTSSDDVWSNSHCVIRRS